MTDKQTSLQQIAFLQLPLVHELLQKNEFTKDFSYKVSSKNKTFTIVKTNTTRVSNVPSNINEYIPVIKDNIRSIIGSDLNEGFTVTSSQNVHFVISHIE